MNGVPILPVNVAEWPRNSRETMRVRLDTFNGHPTVDLRAWFAGAQGEMKPGRSGLTIGVRHLPELADAVSAALAHARKLGLVD